MTLHVGVRLPAPSPLAALSPPAARSAVPPRGAAPRRARPAPQSQLDRALNDAMQVPQPEATTFAALGLPAPLVTALAEREIHAPFSIQARALPDALAGRDVLGRAQTGSGKTLAFGLPVLTRLGGVGRKAA